MIVYIIQSQVSKVLLFTTSAVEVISAIGSALSFVHDQGQ